MVSRSKPIYGASGIAIKAKGHQSLEDALLELRDNRREFFLVATYLSCSSASATAYAIRAGNRKVDPDEFEFKTSVDKKAGKSYLFARRTSNARPIHSTTPPDTTD